MSLKRVIDKLSKMSKELKDKDILEEFPTILNQLKYLMSIDNKSLGLVEGSDEKIFDVEYAKIAYLTELVKKYMDLKWKNYFSYDLDIIDMFSLESTGEYNKYKDKDKAIISVYGVSKYSINTADIIRNIAHKFRIQHLYHFLNENKEEALINYPSYFIAIAKDAITKEVTDKPMDEKRLYMEIDANNYGIEVSRRMLNELYEMYPNKSKKLESMVHDIQNRLSNESILVQQKLEKEGKLDHSCLSEIYLRKPITSTILVDGEEKDRLLYVDKCLKDNPIIKEEFEVLGILMNDCEFKPFDEIFMNRYKALKNTKDPNKTNTIYDRIIDTDPMLLITKLVIEKDVDGINKFLREHPTFKDQYQEEINELFSTMTTGFDILNLLSKPEYVIMEKKGN